MIGILDGIARTFELAASTWLADLEPLSRNLFFMLAVIQMAWSAIWWTLVRRESGEHVLVVLLRQIFAISLLFTIAYAAPTISTYVIASFEKAGATAGGIDSINPSSIASGGFLLAISLLDGLSTIGLLNPITGPMIVLACLVLVLVYAWMAGVLLTVLVESYIVLGGGYLLVGFAGAKFTASLADAYFVYAVRVGVKLFTIYLILGAAASLAAQWGNLLNSIEISSPGPLFEVMGGALMLALVVTKVPTLASEMVGSWSGFGLERLFVGDGVR